MGTIGSFILNSILLGTGLAMDAFSVSMADGMSAPKLPGSMKIMIPLTFAGFQFLMPVIGWFCVRSIAEAFVSFQRAVPWIALSLLLFIGGKMLMEGIRGGDAEDSGTLLLGALVLQAIATSIDALSVGFTIEKYDAVMALTACLLIAVVTYVICMGGLVIGKKVGTKLTGKASILGGVILIAIGIEIFVGGI